jgi:hypothetical protein
LLETYTLVSSASNESENLFGNIAEDAAIQEQHQGIQIEALLSIHDVGMSQ